MKLPGSLSRNALPLLTTYVCLMAISVGMFIQARGFPATHMGAASPGFFPQVVAVLLFVLSLLGLFELRADPPSAVTFPPRVLLGMASTVAYIGLMHLVGYYPSTFV